MKLFRILFVFLLFYYSALVNASPKIFSSVQGGFAELSSLTESDYQWIGAKIFQNEAASKPKYLTHWGKGEDFPSFGIAHFIWFPENIHPPFEETFPAMVRFVSLTKQPPAWLQKLAAKNTGFHAPWKSKKDFEQGGESSEQQQLRNWLLATQSQQARFVALSFEKRWLKEVSSLSQAKQVELNQQLKQMMSFKQGLFAVIDYFNFKGIGHNAKEQYQGQSWGLISVLEAMSTNPPASNSLQLEQFITAAKSRLQLRTELAPAERRESRWIPGWFKRLDRYSE
ncbi:MAG: hypothetical protein ISEC1_P1285 [Thiomicrorhabdus sp.]|nr:MAG: hypothetical protein ISEC1_P1285 [Thiomicrorhabdus sp.]